MMVRSSLRLVLPAVAAAALLAGCGDPKVQVYEVQPAEAASVAAPVFCYRTLARPDCYAQPQPGPPNRLIGRAPIIVLP